MRIALHDLRQAVVGQPRQPQFLLRFEPAYHGKTESEDLQVDAVSIQHPEPLLHIPQDIDVGRALCLHEGADGERVQAPPLAPSGIDKYACLNSWVVKCAKRSIRIAVSSKGVETNKGTPINLRPE